MLVDFFVPGIPRPGGSKRAFLHPHTKKLIVKDDAKGSREWRADVREAAAGAYQGLPPLEVPLRLEIVFQVVRPRGHFGSGKNAGKVKDSAPAFPTVRPDVTKLIRSTEDALTGVLWRDDALIVEQTARKVYAERPGARIVVSAAGV